jgi:hypothetical protein
MIAFGLTLIYCAWPSRLVAGLWRARPTLEEFGVNPFSAFGIVPLFGVALGWAQASDSAFLATNPPIPWVAVLFIPAVLLSESALDRLPAGGYDYVREAAGLLRDVRWSALVGFGGTVVLAGIIWGLSRATRGDA